MDSEEASVASVLTNADVPKPEYPRPQLVRSQWMNLNGQWQFEIDRGDSGLERGLLEGDLAHTILVPFAPESAASGVEDTDFLHAVWYRRRVMVPAEWAGQDILLHFGAVDHDTTVWVDGTEVARHRGGFSSFSADLSGIAEAGQEITIVVRARDTPGDAQARGKQSISYGNATCNYTRTTGIWQTVWLEPVPRVHITNVRITPAFSQQNFTVVASVTNNRAGHSLRVSIGDTEGVIVSESVSADLELAPTLRLQLPAERVRSWSPADPFLYDVTIELLLGEETVDTLSSYAGLRSVTISGTDILLNGERLFQRLVLDQGYWPETLMTSPSDRALVRDIELSQAAGFNGARLHQKVFEERFYYHADRLGYLVWGEFGDWGVSGHGDPGHNQNQTASFITQWLEVLARDYNHPSIIGWCPLNETTQLIHDRITQLDDVTNGMYLATKAADPSRPVLDASGYSHRVRNADVYDSHSYEQDPSAFRAEQADLALGLPFRNSDDGQPISLPYTGQPYFVSEYGGIWWNPSLAARGDSDDPDREVSWGYGERVTSESEWYERFAGLTTVLLDEPKMFGYCYTQLTDTFQEENGIYDFNREPKFDVDRIREIQTRQASYETTGRTAPGARPKA